MSLTELLGKHLLRPQKPAALEIRRHFETARRHLKDAGLRQLDSTTRFTLAYTAALSIATVVIRASGYRAASVGRHKTTFEILGDLFEEEGEALTKYFLNCRAKRNKATYEGRFDIPETEADGIIRETEKFRDSVIAWLKRRHPKLIA